MAWKKPGPPHKTEAAPTLPEEKVVDEAASPAPLPSGIKDQIAVRTGTEVKTYPVFGLFILKKGRKIYPSRLNNGDAVELSLDKSGNIVELRVV